jgi:hypothetical protein
MPLCSSMSDFSAVVGVTWAALAWFGLDFFSFSYNYCSRVCFISICRIATLKESKSFMLSYLWPLASLRSLLSPFQSISCIIRFTSDGCMAPISLARPIISSRGQLQLITSSSLRCSAPYNSLIISTLLAALPYILSSLCSNYSMEAYGPSRITTAPACPRSDLQMAVWMVSLCMDLSLSRQSIS